MSTNLPWAIDAYTSVTPTPSHLMPRPRKLELTHIPHIATVPQTWPAIFDGGYDWTSTSTSETSPYGGPSHAGTVRPSKPPQLCLTNLSSDHDPSGAGFSIFLGVSSLTFPRPHGTFRVYRTPGDTMEGEIKDLAELAIQGDVMGRVVWPDADSEEKEVTTFTVDGLSMLNSRGWVAHMSAYLGRAPPLVIQLEIMLRWAPPGMPQDTEEIWSGSINIQYRSQSLGGVETEG